jgi:SPP1 gp7 family putative phage head morphogenesis protein
VCGNHKPIVEAIDLSSWTKLIDTIAKDLHNGKLKPTDLNNNLVSKTYTELEKGAALGYGKNWIKFDTANAITVQELKQNLYRFSGVKTYQQLSEMNSLLVDEKGKIRSYSDFKRKVDTVHKKYNRNHLQAEYQTAKRSAQASRQWKGFEKNQDLFPNLKYMTIADDKVRLDHEKLHGVIKAVNDPFWDTHYPPNGWRCRCYVKPTTETESGDVPAIKVEESFNHNVGKTNELFMEKKHPYFVIPKSDKKEVDTKINGLLANHSAKEILKFAKARIVGNKYKTSDNLEFTISNSDMKTVVNKAHADRIGRNNLFYNLKETLKNAKQISTKAEGKGREKYVKWFYYEVTDSDQKYYLNVVLMQDGRYKLHAITDTLIK